MPAKIQKPAKRHPDFPLYVHSAKVWARKILGKVWYFGPWNDHQTVLKKYLTQKDAILAGRDPRKQAGVAGVDNNGCTIRFLLNAFLNAMRARMESDQLSRKMFTQHYEASAMVVIRCWNCSRRRMIQ